MSRSISETKLALLRHLIDTALTFTRYFLYDKIPIWKSIQTTKYIFYSKAFDYENQMPFLYAIYRRSKHEKREEEKIFHCSGRLSTFL